MPAPANDNFASATVISGTSGNAFSTTVGASAEAGEPGHFIYNPGPVYPTGEGNVGPFHSVWFSWTCPADGLYLFTTRGPGTTRPAFASTVNAFTGSAVNSLVRVAPYIDQSVGNSDGLGLDASIVLNAANGTTYYIQVDSRALGFDGDCYLNWSQYEPTRLGGCSTCSPEFIAECKGSIQIADVTIDGVYNFGTFALAAGNWQVVYCGGSFIQNTYQGSSPGPGIPYTIFYPHVVISSAYMAYTGEVYTGAAADIWNYQTSYSPGQNTLVTDHCISSAAAPLVSPIWNCTGTTTPNDPTSATFWFSTPSYPDDCGGINYFSPDIATSGDVCYSGQPAANTTEVIDTTAEYPMFAPASPGPQNYRPDVDYYHNWQNASITLANNDTTYPTAFAVEQAFACSRTSPFMNKAGVIGIGFCTRRQFAQMSSTTLSKISLWENTANNPTVKLVYWPLTTEIVTAASFSITGTGPTWQLYLNVANSSPQDWDNVTVELLATGGITSPSSPQLVDLAASATTGIPPFTCTADPTSGLITATIQLTRNSVVIGTLDFPLYPILSAQFTAMADYERTCTGFKTWHYRFTVAQIWPPVGTYFPAAWGADYSATLSRTDAGNFYNDTATDFCSAVTSMTTTVFGGFYWDPDFPAGASIGVQCLFTYNGLSLPTFSQTVTVPAP